MTGSDFAHHIHVTEKGDPKFVGLAYDGRQRGRSKRLISKAPGASAYRNHRRARRRQAGAADRAERLYRSRVVHGIAPVQPIPVKRQKLNSGEAPTARAGELMRLPKGPSHVKRIGHGVLMTPRFQRDRSVVPRDAGLGLLGRRLCRATRRISSARSIAAIAAMTTSIITSSSA